MLFKENFQGGLNLQFLDDPSFEDLHSCDASDKNACISRNALRLLMMGWNNSWKELISPSTFYSVFIKRDPELIKELRLSFQNGFHTLYKQLKSLENLALNEHQIEQIHLYLSNCLSLLPYSDLTPYESITIPQYVDKKWIEVEYIVKPIELNKKAGQWDNDRVFAYGLEPVFNQEAEPHLIYLGTNFIAGQGFFKQVLSDFNPHQTPGADLFYAGKAGIKEWLKNQNKKVHVCGVSLGGSLSLISALELGKYLSRVDALNPAAIYDFNLHSAKNLVDKPEVVVQIQGNDPIGNYIGGFHESDWHIYRVSPPEDKRGPINFCDHFLNYAGLSGSVYMPVSAIEENKKRERENYWLSTVGRGFVYYGSLVPYNYIIRPSLFFVYQYWQYIILYLTLSLITVTCLAFLASTMVFAAVGIAVAVLGTLLLGLGIYDYVFRNYEPVIASIHQPNSPRNKEMDLYVNQTELTLTSTEWNTYKEVKHSCLNTQKNHKDPDFSLKSENMDEKIPLHCSKARAAKIIRTLGFINKLGQDNEGLKLKIQEQEKLYQLGKKS